MDPNKLTEWTRTKGPNGPEQTDRTDGTNGPNGLDSFGPNGPEQRDRMDPNKGSHHSVFLGPGIVSPTSSPAILHLNLWGSSSGWEGQGNVGADDDL